MVWVCAGCSVRARSATVHQYTENLRRAKVAPTFEAPALFFLDIDSLIRNMKKGGRAHTTMTRNIHIAACVLLALAYLVTSSALTVSSFFPLFMGKGTAEVVPYAGKTKDVPRPVFVQRRHMPLVKLLSVPALVACTTAIPLPDTQRPVLIRLDADDIPTLPDRSPFTGRSPPLS